MKFQEIIDQKSQIRRQQRPLYAIIKETAIRQSLRQVFKYLSTKASISLTSQTENRHMGMDGMVFMTAESISEVIFLISFNFLPFPDFIM